MILTPKWKKEAKLLHKGAQKFTNYKRDLLTDEHIAEIRSRQADLRKAYRSGNKEETAEAGKQLQATCENALPHYKGNDPLTENVEVFFVAIVIALGLRAYYLQPFRIPTGSMRPTLNGFVGHKLDQEKWPAAPLRYAQALTHGRSYFSVTTDGPDRIVSIKEGQKFHFFSRTEVTLASGETFSFGGTISSFMEAVNKKAINEIAGATINWENPDIATQQLATVQLPANFTIAEGYVTSGDLVLVDKFSYHFRDPEPGEVFVFDTREISKIRSQPGYGSHYIKRLIATPGDTVELRGGDLVTYRGEDGQVRGMVKNALIFRNAAKMKEPGILRVEAGENGYRGYSRMGTLLTEGRVLTLRDRPSTGLSEYWAMGDNSLQSSDSRDWGTVKEFNLVGPALFSLWPLGSGHWGFID